MIKGKVKEYSLFTGCLIPSKFPFIEKATRWVFDALKIKLHEIEGASCCPNQMAIQSSNKSLWYALAARNLCLAEKKGHDIVSLCNGCYDTLKTVNTKLKGDDKFREKTNEILREFDLEFTGIIDVMHIVQVLHDDVGLLTLDRSIKNPLSGIKLAPFEGCHSKRPMDHMGFDSPVNPEYLEDLIKVLGAKSVSYSEHSSCCGGGLSIGRPNDVVPAAKRVLCSADDSEAAALVVNCPFCFAQFFRSEKEIAEIYFEDLQLPVFYITQLIGLAMGASESDLGLSVHYEMSMGAEKNFVHRLLERKIMNTVYDDDVTKEQLEICASCLACCDDCSTAMTTSSYHPEELLRLVLEGKLDEAISRDDIWFCMNCHECTTQCPQDFGMVKLIVRLKNLAAEVGIYPAVVGHRRSELHEMGYSFEPDLEKRKEMGLVEISFPDIEKLRKLIKKTKTKESETGGK
jgi:heterodisulfide reductase subunit B